MYVLTLNPAKFVPATTSLVVLQWFASTLCLESAQMSLELVSSDDSAFFPVDACYCNVELHKLV